MPSVAVTISALLPEDCTNRGSQPSKPRPLTTTSLASAIFFASAGAGGREEDRRCQARRRQWPRFGGLAATVGAILGEQGRDRDGDRRHRPAQVGLGCRSACLAIGAQREDLCHQYP